MTAFQIELARSHFNIGVVLSLLGDVSGAMAAQRQALAIQRKLASSSPSILEFQVSMANTYESIGNLFSAVGEMSGAAESHANALAIRQKLAEANPGVPEIQAGLAGSLSGLGWLRLKSGEPSAAVDYFSREEAIWKKLAGANPTVKDYRNSLANCQTNGATVLIRLGRAAEARTALRGCRCGARVACECGTERTPVPEESRGEPAPIRAGAPGGRRPCRRVGRLAACGRSSQVGFRARR